MNGYCQSELCWGSSYIGDDDVEKVVAGIAELGGSWVRMGVQAGSLADLDRAVKLAVAQGLRPLLCLIGNPALPGGYDGTAVSFAAQCKFLALRYGPGGTDPELRNTVSEFEIFNEANISPNNPRVADGTGFAPYLRAAYTAIKAVHTSSTVIAGGTIPYITNPNAWAPSLFPPFIIFGSTSDPVKWYTDLYASGCKDFMDAVAVHLYFDDGMMPDTTATQWGYIPGVRDVMDANGDSGKKIWITETGTPCPLNADAATLAAARDRLKAIVDLLVANTDPLGLGVWFIYNYRCYVGGDGVGGTFGMVNVDFTHRTPIWEYAQTIGGTGGADTTPPSAPTDPTVSDVTDTSAVFTWGPSTDDTGVFVYRLYDDSDTKVAEAQTTSATLDDLTPGTGYSGFYVTAVDAAGNESDPSDLFDSVTTSAPTGAEQRFAYDFTGTGSTVPTVFSQIGDGFAVSGGVASPIAATEDGDYYLVAPYYLDQQSPDHSSEISQAETSAHPDRAAFAVVRMKPDGTRWVGACITGGGEVDACKIVTFDAGVVRVRDAANAAPLLPGETLRIRVRGNIYTAARRVEGVATDLLSWTDINGVHSGGANLRAGIGWRHKRVGGEPYPAPGITGLWKAADLSAVQQSGGVSDAWTLAVTDPADWPLLFAGISWESTMVRKR